MFKRIKKNPRPHRTEMERAAAQAVHRAVHIETYSGDPGDLTLRQYKNRNEFPGDTSTMEDFRARQAKDSAAYQDIRTWTGAVWALREDEQKVTDLKRAEYVARYRPIQTLDGLDPSPRRVALRNMTDMFKAVAEALRG